MAADAAGPAIDALRIVASPSEVDAGAEITLEVDASSASLAECRGGTLLITDEAGAAVQTLELTAAADETRLVVMAPLAPGRHTWCAALRPAAGPPAKPAAEHASTAFSFAVKPHALQLVVWDVPRAVECGAAFAIKLGVKCLVACRPAGWAVEVRDGEGNLQAQTAPGDEPWPGTAALYAVQVELHAPQAAGLHDFEARVRPVDHGVAHAEGRAVFGVRTVVAPECRLTVTAVAKGSRAPIAGARIVAHPYRASTDARGTAELALPRGAYRLFVSGKGFLPFRSDVELANDATLTAELVVDAGPTDADVWG